jgi:hypothetical protein
VTQPTVKGTERYALYIGDSITAGVTHQIEVGRDKSWVKYEVITKVQPGEDAEDARTRAIGHVNESVDQAVSAAVHQIRRQ